MRGSSGGRARGRAPTRTHTNTEQPRRQGGGAGAAMRGRSPAGSSVQPVVVALPRVHVAAPRHGLRMSTGSAVASAIGEVVPDLNDLRMLRENLGTLMNANSAGGGLSMSDYYREALDLYHESHLLVNRLRFDEI